MCKEACDKIQLAKEYIFITAGAFITALGFELFLVPNSIAAGGAGGLGTVIYHAFSIPVSVVVAAVNTVLFAFGYKYLSKGTLIKTLYATAVLTGFMQALSRFDAITENLLLASIYGGLCFGTGTGVTIANGGSTGGSDMTAVLLHRKFRFMPVARLILFVDLTVILLSGIVFSDFELMLYGAIALYVCSITADAIIEGVNFSKLVFVVSKHSEEIAKSVISELDRGITALSGKGMYSGNSYSVLMCAVRRNQFVKLKKIIQNTDKNAFIILTDAREVIGKGFNIND